jgi:hypothetical protein
MLWADNPGTLSEGLYVPNGFEVGADTGLEEDTSLFDQFLILSDHNRSPLQFNPERIQLRERTINGKRRSYHIADKLSMTVSWNMLPSRAYAAVADFNESGISPYKSQSSEFTVDGGAGGVELFDWYENHKGSFWVYLAYDKYTNFADGEGQFGHLGQYNQIMEVDIANFNYEVVKRGQSTFDFWNISVTLEEV